jgi:hypothetical protein
MIVIGCDPGISGAVAILDDEGLSIIDMPILKIKRGTKARSIIDASDLCWRLREIDVSHGFIEIAGCRPKEGVSSAFTNGRNYGMIMGVIGALGIPITEISSVKWKKDLRVPADKDGARFRASQLLPQFSHHWNRKKDDGRAEAALIALYGQLELNKT